jgi:hypothetical protein
LSKIFSEQTVRACPEKSGFAFQDDVLFLAAGCFAALPSLDALQRQPGRRCALALTSSVGPRIIAK